MPGNEYGLIRGDAIRIPLRDASVDAIITSPPYFALRSYQDDGTHYDGQIGSEPTPADFLTALWAVTDELWRVLKPTGSLFVNLGDKYAGSGGHNNSGLNTDEYWRGHNWDETRNAPKSYNKARDVPVKSLMGLPWRYVLGLTCPDTYRPDPGPQWTLRAEIIWSKPNGLPESVTDRVRRSHEQWFHVTKSGRYFAAVDEVREQYAPGTAERYALGFNLTGAAAAGQSRNAKIAKADGGPSETNPLGKLPGSVWSIPSEPLNVPDHIGVDHFAAFPQEWPRRLILGWTPSGICTACREGRVPVVDKKLVPGQFYGGKLRGAAAAGEVVAGGTETEGRHDQPWFGAATEATITGYACACDVTLAPTRPAVVLDPFVGTGTVPMVARALGRYGVGLDLSRDYLNLARWRIGESKHGAKTINRTNRERQGNLW